MSKVTMIKKDAVVSIKVSAAFLQRVQKVMFSLIIDKSPEEIEQFKTEADKIKQEENYLPQFSEDWMDNLFTMTVLINEVESTIIKEGLTYEEEVPDNVNPLESSLPDQSQSQPE